LFYTTSNNVLYARWLVTVLYVVEIIKLHLQKWHFACEDGIALIDLSLVFR
jgi:hypothetical protein